MAEEAQEYGLYGHSISVVLDLEASEDLPAETQEFFALDPGPLMDYLSQKGRGYAHVQKCNRFVLPTGKEYGRGWILMNAQTVKEMITLWQKRNSNGAVSIATPYRWTIKFRPAGPENNNGVEIKKLEIASVHSVTGYNVDYWADFPADIKLPVDDHYVIVEFVDARFSFQQSSFCTTDQAGDVGLEQACFNLRAYDILDESNNATFLTNTWRYDVDLDDYFMWEWQDLVNYLLELLPLTSYPDVVSMKEVFNLESAIWPVDPPENLNFQGMTIWDAICQIVNQTQNCIWRDNDGNWFIASYKDNPYPFENKSTYNDYLEDPSWDLPRYPLENNNILLPQYVVFHFPNTDHDFQQDTISLRAVDGADWYVQEPLHSEILAFNNRAIPGTKTHLFLSTWANWGNAPDPYGYITTRPLTEICGELLPLYKAAKGWTAESKHNIYLYYHDLKCGTDISAVQWYNTGNGPKTEILRNPFKYTPGDELYELGDGHKKDVLSWENFAPPDIARKTVPITRVAVGKAIEKISAYRKDEFGDLIDPNNNFGLCEVNWSTDAGSNYWIGYEAENLQPNKKFITVYNLSANDIPADALIICHWHIQSRRWIALYVPSVPQIFTGTLNDVMCPGDVGKSSDIRGINTCPDTCGSGSGSGGSFEVTLTNPFKLAGKAGDKFLAIKDLCAGLNSQCVIFQVQHDSYELVEHPFIHVGSRTCEGMVGAGNRTPGVDPDSQDGQCNIDYKWRAFSVMTCYTNSTQEHLIESVFTQVLTDWWVDGLCIKGKFNWIWALCGCTPQETILAGGTDCAYGSSCVE